MEIAQTEKLHSAEVQRPSEVIIDAISLTINGIRFFRCPTPEELNRALKSSARLDKSGLYVWDNAGISLFWAGNTIEFCIDSASQTQHGYEACTKDSFNGTISIFGKDLPTKPLFNDVKQNLDCTPRELHFKHAVDFEKLTVADTDPNRVSSISVEIYLGRFPPKPIFSLIVNFNESDDPFTRERFGLQENEGIIARHGPDSAQFSFVVTNKRLIAVKRNQDDTTSLEDNWNLSEVRGFHILPRSPNWWQKDFYRQRFTIELENRTVQLVGFFDLYAHTRFWEPAKSDRFFKFLRMAKMNATQRTTEISCTRPAEQEQTTATYKNEKLIPCSTCGKLVAKSARHCPHCGAASPVPISNRLYIPCSCGHAMHKFARHCVSCGCPNVWYRNQVVLSNLACVVSVLLYFMNVNAQVASVLLITSIIWRGGLAVLRWYYRPED